MGKRGTVNIEKDSKSKTHKGYRKRKECGAGEKPL